jgi:hypothetical protein
MDESTQEGEPSRRPSGSTTLPEPGGPENLHGRSGLAMGLFGALAGIPIGALIGGVCCWLVDYGDYAWYGAACGAAIGFAAGAITGMAEHLIRGELVKPDIATHLGFLLGLFPTALLFLGFGAAPGGRFSGYLCIGGLCAGPMGGLLVGAMLDRVHDALGTRSWTTVTGFTLASLAICLGPLYLIQGYSDPDPKMISRETRKLMAERFSFDPEWKGARIHKLELEHQGDRIYTGIAEITLHDRPRRLDVESHIRLGELKASWKLRDD